MRAGGGTGGIGGAPRGASVDWRLCAWCGGGGGTARGTEGGNGGIPCGAVADRADDGSSATVESSMLASRT
jgi:hypothetical protein